MQLLTSDAPLGELVPYKYSERSVQTFPSQPQLLNHCRKLSCTQYDFNLLGHLPARLLDFRGARTCFRRGHYGQFAVIRLRGLPPDPTLRFQVVQQACGRCSGHSQRGRQFRWPDTWAGIHYAQAKGLRRRETKFAECAGPGLLHRSRQGRGIEIQALLEHKTILSQL